jgi:hypothetical protein
VPLSDLRLALRLSEQDVIIACNPMAYRSAADVLLKLIEQMPKTDFWRQLKAKLQDAT